MMRIVRHEPPESEASTKLPRSSHTATPAHDGAASTRAHDGAQSPQGLHAHDGAPPSLMADVWPLALAVIFGTTVDESYGDEMAVTVVATSFDSTEARARLTNPA